MILQLFAAGSAKKQAAFCSACFRGQLQCVVLYKWFLHSKTTEAPASCHAPKQPRQELWGRFKHPSECRPAERRRRRKPMSKAKHRTTSSRTSHTCQSVTEEDSLTVFLEGGKVSFFHHLWLKKTKRVEIRKIRGELWHCLKLGKNVQPQMT